MMKNNNINRNLYNKIRVYPAEMGTQTFGRLQVRCTTRGLAPIDSAIVQISSSAEPEVIIEELTTDFNGLTQEIELPAPPIDYSLNPAPATQPYSEFNLRVSAPDFEPVTVSNVEILTLVTALQELTLTPAEIPTGGELYVIPPHTLYGDYPPKIEEEEIKAIGETGEIVLQNVVIPEYIVVHDGPPTDTAAQNHYVRYRDYIKNVASSEIYATWPESTIMANILAIQSFTLNRVFTEWYRNQGYNFTITSSTAFDHKWIPGRNIYSNIGLAVDQIFTNYLSRPNVKQPILTQYCDGYRVQCPNWMTQWGSKELGENGLNAIQILQHFYGDSMFINTAPQVSGVPASWPGVNLTIGSTGVSVRMIQEQLNRISDTYVAIPKIAVDGQYGPQTADAVRIFQQIFNLPQTGVVDFATWYKISHIYVGVTRIAE